MVAHSAGAALRRAKASWRSCLLLACAAELRRSLKEQALAPHPRKRPPSESIDDQQRTDSSLVNREPPYLRDLLLR